MIQPYIINMVLSGIAYLIMIYFMYRMLRKPDGDREGGDDGNDGGIAIDTLPDLDLPPGICLPGQGPTKKPVDTPVTDPEPVAS